MQILKIDSSSRTEGSHSRKAAQELTDKLLKKHPDAKLVVRDLVGKPATHIADLTIQGFFTPPEALTPELKAALAQSDALLDEVFASDIIVISAPMYNFSVPSVLKAYIDQIVRIGKTFAINDGASHGKKVYGSFYGLLNGKKVYVVTAYGTPFGGTPLEPLNFFKPYLTGVLGFIGITDVEFLELEGTVMDPAAFERTQAEVQKKIAAV